ncbi:hypothetical protein DXT99_03625 [Pontibacter diazotrophicus]|uniref:Uncharacterized protein n=1 Tax=Pontibacter diazotrophicus TaxID=1400979 RepID=A0A3D8LG01_9BACT|nr:hypothetical protein [Pontibacter diazotrophicus]RDV16308.1 hypothetical protein DXT99_03625 [Pontibacter diazotrophicus]
MNKLTLLLPFAFVTQLSFAQTNVPTGLDAERNLADIGSNKTGTMIRTYDNRYEGVKGTPFFNEEWSKATVTTGNKLFANMEVKYNAYENNILYRNTKGEQFVLEPNKVESFVIEDNKTKQEYNFRRLPDLVKLDAKLANQFVLVMHDGSRTQLVMVPEKKLVKADFKGGYSAGRKYDELIDSQTFYFIAPDKKAVKVKLNRKSLLKALPDKQDKVQEYVSAQNIDLNSGEGWAKALVFYESL